MAAPDLHNQYYTLQSRVASFKISQVKPKRRTSVASKKNQKTTAWPHSFLSPQSLAEAGFYYEPKSDGDDSVTCFICQKSLGGWEEGDDALVEHLKHSGDCGWAITAAIEAGHEDLRNEDPMSERMVQARKVTFGDFWPHDGKKGWTAKSQQLANAGWRYLPSLESDDMAKCVYCDLTLDGWEPKDKPLVEHQRRSEECAFFNLINEYQSAPGRKKAPAKSRSTRASKVPRLSTQSDVTFASEAPSFADEPAEEDDSIMTTATNATVRSRVGGKGAKAKKAATTKVRKTKAKKQEVEEVIEAEPAADIETEVEAPSMARGKKRTSGEMDDEPTPAVEQPKKRRVTRTRGSIAVDESTISLAEDVPDDFGASTASRKRGRPSKAPRKISTASVAAEPEQIPDDEAIEKALEADMDRPLTEDEADPPATQAEAKTTTRRISRVTRTAAVPANTSARRTRASGVPTNNSTFFDSQPVEIDDSSIEKELAAMEIEESRIEESKPLPKAKAAKTKQPRKPSAKQLAAAKKAAAAKAAEEEAEREAEAMNLDTHSEGVPQSPEPAPKPSRVVSRQPRQMQSRSTRTSASSVAPATEENDSGNDTDVSVASQSTVVRGGKPSRGSALKKGKNGKKGASRNIEDTIHRDQENEPVAKQSGKSKKGKELMMRNMDEGQELAVFEDAVESEPEVVQQSNSKRDKGKGRVLQELPIEQASRAVTPSSLSVPFSPKLMSSARRSPQPPSTPGGPQETKASPSPQSSDAENHPPSSRPSAVRNSLNLQNTITNEHTTRIPLASTPTGSPTKRNVISGLQTSQPWTALDLDNMFARSPSKDSDAENRDPGRLAFNQILDKARAGTVPSPEKSMTVEEWIKHNARLAEEKLRSDCERMVGVFEEAGQRAMRSVEGIKCYDDE